VAGRLGYSTAWRPQRGPRGGPTYAEELPLYWRVPVAAWTFVIALPLIAAWAIVNGDWDPVGAIFLADVVGSCTATTNDDGSITVHFGGCGDGRPNCLCDHRRLELHRPALPARSQVLDGFWTFPSIEPA